MLLTIRLFFVCWLVLCRKPKMYRRVESHTARPREICYNIFFNFYNKFLFATTNKKFVVTNKKFVVAIFSEAEKVRAPFLQKLSEITYEEVCT